METREKINTLSTYAPSIFVLLMVVAFLVDVFYTITLTDKFSLVSAGFVFVLFGTGLAFWANASHTIMRNNVEDQMNGANFCVGPYCFMRHPAYTSLLLMGLGIACIINSLAILIATILYYLITQFIVQAEETLLTTRYNDRYTEYQKNVPRYF